MFGKFSANDIPNMQVLYFAKVNTNGKLETKQEVLYIAVVRVRGTDVRGGEGGINVGYSLSTPSHFLLATDL